MKWVAVLGITFIMICMVRYEWPKINENLKREKVAFAILAVTGWVLATLLVFFPDLPNPTQLIEAIYGPLGKLLEK